MSQVQQKSFHIKNIHFYVGSYIKFYVESAKCHIGDIEKSPKLKHGPFRKTIVAGWFDNNFATQESLFLGKGLF